MANSALETARRFAEAGAQWVHMVDLDGARDGVRANFPLIYEVIQQSGLRVELGGGVKSIPDVITIVEAGAAGRSSALPPVTDPAVLDYAVNWKPEQIAVGIDCLNGKVRIGGLGTGLRPGLFGVRRQVEAKGVKTIIFTDIATDGMLSGPSFQQLEALQKTVPCNIVASGGVATLDDVKRLRDMGLYGAIIGKAYYAGTLDLPQAVKEAGPQC